MSNHKKYKTKQKVILLNFFETVPGQHITAAEICNSLKKNGISIGQATVYRQLESLVGEGIIKKYYIDANSPACFEYIPPDECEDEEIYFHCKCEKCGKLIHLNCNSVVDMKNHLFAEHGFEVDPFRTVFYGLCDQCNYK